MNKVFFTDLYLNITLYMIIMLFTLLTSSYILLNNDYNIMFRILSIIVLISVIFLLLKSLEKLFFEMANFKVI